MVINLEPQRFGVETNEKKQPFIMLSVQTQNVQMCSELSKRVNITTDKVT